jgi:glutathione S-transferase
MKVYGYFMSQPSRAVMLFCKENNIPFELKETNFVEGGARSAEFVKINPNHTIPVLDDDGFLLYESHTILRYLARKFLPENSNWYPRKDIKAVSLVDQYLDWHHLHTRNYGTDLFHGLISLSFLPFLFQEDLKQYRIQPLSVQLNKSLATLDKTLEKSKFVAGEEVSIADLSIACELYQLKAFGWHELPKFPHVWQWLLGFEQRPLFVEAHKEVVEEGRKFMEKVPQSRLVDSSE